MNSTLTKQHFLSLRDFSTHIFEKSEGGGEGSLRVDHLFRRRKGLQNPGGVHDLRMDGGLPPGFQKATLF